MRMILTSVTALGFAMFAMALGGINTLAADVEKAAPPKPAPRVLDVQTREVDCPFKQPEPRRL
jgi:hypothetical protein